MPTNLLKKDNPNKINNDSGCAPLTRSVAGVILETAIEQRKFRQQRISAITPRLRVELHKNVLNGMTSLMPVTLLNRGQSTEPIDLTPFVVSLETSKSINPSSLGACSITIKSTHLTSRVKPSTKKSFTADPYSIEWLDEIEDNDIIVVHLDSGMGNVNSHVDAETNTQQIDFAQSEVMAQSVVSASGGGERYHVSGAGKGHAPLVFFGFVDSVQRTRVASGTGGANVSYTLACSDFTKALDSCVKFVGIEKQTSESLKRTLQESFQLAKNAGSGVRVTPEQVASALIFGLLDGRSLTKDDLDTVRKRVQQEAKNAEPSAPAVPSATPSSSETEPMIEFDIAKELYRLVSEQLNNDFNGPSALKLTPKRFLLPKTLTQNQGSFDCKPIGHSNPHVRLFHEFGGVQLAELFQLHTGNGTYQYTPKGSAFSASKDSDATAVLGGQYGCSPSYLRITTAAIKALYHKVNIENNTVGDAILDAITTGADTLRYFVDLCDFYRQDVDLKRNIEAITLPTVMCHTYPRPLNLLDWSEIDSYIKSVLLGGGSSTELDDNLMEAYGSAGLSFINTPITFLMESDLISETLVKDGSQRTTLSGVSASSPQAETGSALNTVALYVKGQPNYGRRISNPLFHDSQSELAHGFLPTYATNPNVEDDSATASDGSVLAGAQYTNAMFVAHRDKTLTNNIEIKGTLLSGIVLPSARVGQRVAVFRENRVVPPYEEFEKIYNRNLVTGGINLRFADDFSFFGFADEGQQAETAARIKDLLPPKKEGNNIETINELKNALSGVELDDRGKHDFHGAKRAHFFAHFDCFVIDEVSHSLDINPQDGGIEANTSLTVSYGALGKEYPKPTSEVLPTSNTVNLGELRVKADLRHAGPPQKIKKSKAVKASDTIRQQYQGRVSKRAADLRAIGLASDTDTDMAVWKSIRSDSKIATLTRTEAFLKHMSAHFVSDIAQGTTQRTAELEAGLDNIETTPNLTVMMPPAFNKYPYLLMPSLITFMLSVENTERIKVIDPFSGLDAEVDIPTRGVPSTGLKVAIVGAVDELEGELIAMVSEARTIRSEFANALNETRKTNAN